MTMAPSFLEKVAQTAKWITSRASWLSSDSIVELVTSFGRKVGIPDISTRLPESSAMPVYGNSHELKQSLKTLSDRARV